MKRTLFFTVLLLNLFCLIMPVCADSAVSLVYGETYMCGDSFEVIVQDEPQFAKIVTRKPPGSAVIQIKAGKDEILVEVHIKVRNLSDKVYDGLSPESFKLTGYVRGRPLSYVPEVMSPYDYGSKEHYTLYDKMYYRTYAMAPLRQIDMLLVYRINPILRDLELHIAPQGTNGVLDHYLQASYSPMDLEPCDGIFRFVTVRNIETGEITKYYR